MSPEDVELVRRSWGELAPRRRRLAAHLSRAFAGILPPDAVEARAGLLVECVGELVDLLSAPSRLDARAQQFAADWPGAPPSAGVDGQAWVIAAGAVDPTWSDAADRAWHHAWLVLGDVLADGARSPFAGTT